MSLLAKAQTGANITSMIYTIFGSEGVGKSTFAAGFPSPIFADIENGTKSLSVSRLTRDELPGYQDLINLVHELKTSKHSFKTFVIDSLTALETMMSKHILSVVHKNKYHDISEVPFGQGYSELTDLTVTLMNELRALQVAKDMDVVLVGHTRIKSFTDAYDNTTYDRYIIQVNEKMAEKIKAFSDNVFFIKNQVTVIKGDNGKTQAIGTGERVIYTEYRPGADAKNRLNLPYQIPASYSAVRDAINNYQPKEEALKADIDKLKSKADATTLAAVSTALDKAGNDILQLERIKQKLITVVGV